MPFSFPTNCDTPAKRTEFAYRCQELLRLLHVVMGTWYRDGLTLTQWNKLPTKVRTRYPYQPKLTLEQMKDFKFDVFEPISFKITEVICAQRDLLKVSTNWTVEVEDLL